MSKEWVVPGEDGINTKAKIEGKLCIGIIDRDFNDYLPEKKKTEEQVLCFSLKRIFLPFSGTSPAPHKMCADDFAKAIKRL